jgi:methionine synthase I (cobalamin-dependent)/5,10-methylenetetrahydrofolate reductase
MSTNAFFTAIQSNDHPLLADGAMGTMLHTRGASFEHSFDELNLTDPALVSGIHRDYIQAGAQVIKTNTFGANRFKLARQGLEGQVQAINQAGANLARRAGTDSLKQVFIAGDVGPLGVHLAPFGRVQPEQAREVFVEQMLALGQAGVDLFLIETMVDLYEVNEAIAAAHLVGDQLGDRLPVVASMTFTRDDRTLLGDGPEKVACTLNQSGADVIGVNCSGGPAQLLRILKQMGQAVPGAHFAVMPNAGWPEQVGGRIMYPATPEYFGEYALAFWQAGARLIGGCCGTTPAHISVMRRAIDLNPPQKVFRGAVVTISEREELVASSDQPTLLSQKLAAGKFVTAVEMDPPRGLSTHKLLAGASLLAEAGADVIDVADSPMARMRMSPWAVCNLIQSRINIETVLHFPTRGRNLLRVQGDLLASHALGVRNVFVVMGDPTSIGDYPDAMDNYDLVPSGLIKLIKQGFNLGVDHSGSTIGQPTSFFVGCALNVNPADIGAEIKNLRRKLRAGADFILTQPVFDVEPLRAFLRQYQQEHGALGVPVLAGILPLANARHALFLNQEVPGIAIPLKMMSAMEQAGENGPRTGVEIAIELVGQLKPYTQGIYIMPAFNRFDYAAEIIEAVK